MAIIFFYGGYSQSSPPNGHDLRMLACKKICSRLGIKLQRSHVRLTTICGCFTDHGWGSSGREKRKELASN
ncbi:hypothetical protein TIFTF001_055764 [Ficus carica]|uniref:Uncharacterized protein n=1 Tax=Ficus carica TaxID=3494 RepID=A0AA88JEN5_FICCA|nr:hypothetical protein TIFTF001_055764 [Ficus carica]